MNLFNILSSAAFANMGRNDLRSEPLNNFGEMAQARTAANATGQVNAKIRILEDNLAKSMLLNEVLWELISQRLNLSEADLLKKVEEIDLRDGKLDGKNQRKAVKCPSCGHTVSARHAACLYCGKVIDTSIFTIN